MNLYIILTVLVVLSIGFTHVSVVNAQVDPLSEIVFFQSGELHTENDQFQISDDFTIREFSNSKIIRISGQTIEGFPYITYSKIFEDATDTHGIIFINNQFQKLSFTEKIIQTEQHIDKKDDLTIVTQYTQRVYSKQLFTIDVKIFENDQKPFYRYDQNYGQVSNVNVDVIITDENNQQVFSTSEITNDKGLIKTEYQIQDNAKRETLTIAINAENENSASSKILQLFVLGNKPANNDSPPGP